MLVRSLGHFWDRAVRDCIGAVQPKLPQSEIRAQGCLSHRGLGGRGDLPAGGLWIWAYGCFCNLGMLLVGVFVIRALLFGACVGAPGFLKLLCAIPLGL